MLIQLIKHLNNLSTYQFFPLNVPSLNQPKATTKGLYSANGEKPELASSPLAGSTLCKQRSLTTRDRNWTELTCENRVYEGKGMMRSANESFRVQRKRDYSITI